MGRHEVDGEKQAGGLVIPRRPCARAGLSGKERRKAGIDVGPWLVHTDLQLSCTEYVRLFTNHSRQPGGQAAAAQYGYWQYYRVPASGSGRTESRSFPHGDERHYTRTIRGLGHFSYSPVTKVWSHCALLPLDELLRLREPQKWVIRRIWGLGGYT